MSRGFSFSGRIGRGEYWVWSLVATATLLGSALLWYVLDSMALSVAGALVAVAIWVPACVRRLHDRHKPGAWVLFAMVPVIGTLWSIVELGFRRGTPGLNRYGRPVEAVEVDLTASSFDTAPRLTNVMWNQPLLLGRRPETRSCPSCNGDNEATSMFCSTCGARLTVPATATLRAS